MNTFGGEHECCKKKSKYVETVNLNLLLGYSLPLFWRNTSHACV